MKAPAALALLVVLIAVTGALCLPRGSVMPAPVSATVVWNAAVAALEAGDLVTAESRAEEAAVVDPGRFEGRRAFLRGCSSWRRLEQAEFLAAQPEAGAPALDAAIAEARRAASYFLAAARREEGWPEARRNLQRALEKLVYLEKRRELMRERAKRERPDDAPAEPEEGMPLDQEIAIEIENRELGPAALGRLLDLLARKERQKLELRRRRLDERSRTGGRDW